MSDRCVGIRRESSHNGNYIPAGRQLPRTPPLDGVKRCLDFCEEEENRDEDRGSLETQGDGGQEDNRLNETFDCVPVQTKSEPNDDSMLKGMKGYQLTQGDLEFIQRMKEEKLLKQLRGDLEELRRALKRDMMAAELVYASRECALVELNKFPSCEELTEWAKAVVGTTRPLAEFSDLDAVSLLAVVTEEEVRKVVDKKRVALAQMRKTVENKRKKEAKAKESLEKQIAKEQMKIQGLMSQLSDLKSQLEQEEEVSKAREMHIDKGEMPKVKAEVGNADSLGGVQGTRGAKERRALVKFTEKLQDTTNQSKSARSKLADDQTGGKGRADKSAGGGSRTRQKSRAVAEKPPASGRAAGGSRTKVEEMGASLECERAVGGRGEPPGASQTKSRGRGRTGEAAAGGRRRAAVAAEEAGPRRSKRIASKR